MNKTKLLSAVLAFCLLALSVSSCSQKLDPSEIYTRSEPLVSSADDGAVVGEITIDTDIVPLAAGPASTILSPVASGKTVYSNTTVIIDASNAKEGYIMIKYTGTSKAKLVCLLTGPDKVEYKYVLNGNGDYDVFPLSGGDGKYSVTVLRNVKDNSYAKEFAATVETKLTNQFSPFLYSNQYVNYNAESKVVKKATELCKDIDADLDKIKAVYEYVVANFTYDYDKAETVKSGYLPEVDKILDAKKGICFDYAAVMCAMLRSQGVPSKLVVGYAGTVYHAWISAYTAETGWIEKVIYFDGTNWKLMDPTFASSGMTAKELAKYIGDGSSYSAMFLY
jgi:Transglutaminase-like enzymes, putative cysteine proteases